MEIQESELRKIRSEKELLQKQLREREVQLQAVSDKVRPKSVVAMASRRHSSWEFGIFATSLSHRQEGGEPVAVKLKSKIFSFQFCSLTEEQRQEEAVVAMVEENQNLQQVVAEQEFQLAEQNKLISELQGTISQLQAEAVSTRLHLLEQKQAQRETQRQLEALQHTELQTRVALELISSKFERYRNKIIQATFSVEGIQDPQGELTDDDVLEAMQKIFNERTEFQQMLKNKGSRTSLLSSDSSTASPARRRKSSRMEKL
uniref:Coiled-coil domain containing 27 n=1 Tax=Zonotrichia albicollis TaxID=44394 RepID=A0A8D2M7Q4_ZONAL